MAKFIRMERCHKCKGKFMPVRKGIGALLCGPCFESIQLDETGFMAVKSAGDDLKAAIAAAVSTEFGPGREGVGGEIVSSRTCEVTVMTPLSGFGRPAFEIGQIIDAPIGGKMTRCAITSLRQHFGHYGTETILECRELPGAVE